MATPGGEPLATSPRAPRLSPATRLGPYEIVGALGAGGMGEVYRARDIRLEREVAVKVLPTGFADNESFRARFEREAKSISALNHPHICTIHDVGREELDGSPVDFLVLELIEGQSLADRIAKGPLPMAQVIEYGSQIASALDAAHRRDIVHRDLKPANVMITKSGTKLLDFGLARSGTQPAVASEAISSLPTKDMPADRPLTEPGTIMGTFQYMAPEQLEGRPADARTDIFALGTVLYEMATGRRAFEGKTRPSLIAAIVSSHPPTLSSVNSLAPPALDHVVQKCLEKDPDDRWQSARDVAAELSWIGREGSRAGVPAALVSRRKNRERLAWGLCAILAVTTGALAVGYGQRTPRPAPVVRFNLALPEGILGAGPPRISPDGRLIAFNAVDATGKVRVWIRALDELHARAVPGTEGMGTRPFWSPDSRQIALFHDRKLKRVDIAGGPVQTVCDAAGSDGSWGASGTILFDGGGEPLFSVAAAGGAPRPEVALDPAAGLAGVGWPEFLPDGRHFLFLGGTAMLEDATLFVGEVGAKARKPLFKTSSQVHYADPGYLVYVREQMLVAHPFDAGRLEVTGDPLPIGDKLALGTYGVGPFTLSRNGTLVFRSGAGLDSQLVWVDRSGREAGVATPAGIHGEFAASLDGTRVALMLKQRTSWDIWIRDLVRGAMSRLTFDPALERTPVWFPDGSRVVFSSLRKGPGDLYVKRAGGTETEEILLENDEEKYPSDISADGRWLLFLHQKRNGFSWDVSALPLAEKGRPVRITSTPFSEWSPTFSPDARFIAYESDETGRNEIYVQDFPDGQNRWQVSTAGGFHPTWRADGREMFYLGLDNRLMSVPVEWKTGFTARQPEPLFQARLMSGFVMRHYQPAPDGQRFLVRTALDKQAIPTMTVVLNWPEAVRK